MAYVYYVYGFDGQRWKAYGDEQWVTETGAKKEADRLAAKFPRFRWEVRKGRPQVLSRLVQLVA